MTTYKAIHGKTIKHLASDPDSSASEGEIWFNTTSSDYKTIVKAAGAWATGGATNTGSLSQAGFGTQTAAMKVGGRPGEKDVAEIYDGSSWTEVNDLQTARAYQSGLGTTTAGLVFGGILSDAQTALSEEYDGTNWAEGNNMGTGRYLTGTFGTQTAGLAATGNTYDAVTAVVEQYDGSSWSEVGDVNTARVTVGSSGVTQTSGIIFGGRPTNRDETEEWNGTSWTEVANLGQSATTTGGCSISSTATMKIGGYSGPPEIYYNFTEEWQDPVIGAKTITTS